MTKKPTGFGEEDLEELLLQRDPRREWSRARDELVGIITELGFPAELGEAIARHLGSPKAIHRMTQYLYYVRPNRAELIVDEMLAIRSEIDAWKEKKAGRRASVCTGEKVAGFRSQDGKVHEIMLIRSDRDLEAFREQYGVIGEIKTVY